MGPERPPANALCPRQRNSRLLSGACRRSAPLATPGASAGKSCELGPSEEGPIPLSGSVVSATEAMGRIETNCARQPSSSGAIWRRTGCRKSARLSRLDGLYGTGAVLAELAGFLFVSRGKDYTVLDQPEIQARLHLPPDQTFSRPESTLVRSLYDCPEVAVGPAGVRCRVVVATHPAAERKHRIGHIRKGIVYELFFTALPQKAFTAADVVALYLHRGAFEPQLADEDVEQDADRWCSHSPAGQEAWQAICQWVWNLRLELGHVLLPRELRTVSRLLLPLGRPHRRMHRSRAMASLRSPCPGKLAVSRGRTSPSSLTGRYAVQPANHWWHMSDVEKLMGACAWCTQPASAVAAPVLCATSVNGRAAPLLSRAKSVCSYIPSSLVQPLCSGEIGAGGFIGGSASNCCVINAWRCRSSPAVLLARVSRLHPCLVRSGRIIASVFKSGWRGPARAPTAGQVMIKLFGIPETFATSLGLATA